MRIIALLLSFFFCSGFYLAWFSSTQQVETLVIFHDMELIDTTLQDISGNHNHGTLVGDPTQVTGLIGTYALDFDGDDYVIMADDPTFDSVSAFSVSCWVQRNSSLTNWNTLFHRQHVDDDGGDMIFIGTSANKFAVNIETDAGVAGATYANADFNVDTWYHLVVIWDGATLTLYQDTVAQTDTASLGGSFEASDNPIWIGAETNDGSTPDGYFDDGKIDQLKWFNYALLENEIDSLYAERPSIPDDAESHYATQAGAGTQSGSSLANAFSVADFNNPSNWDSNVDTDNNMIGPGDTVYFSGTILSQVEIAGSGTSSGQITIDGLLSGDCDPLTTECTSSAEIQRIDSTGILINQQDYITVQDFRLQGAAVAIEGSSASADSDHIQIKRLYIRDGIGQGIDVDYGNHIVIGGYNGDGNKIENIGDGTGGGDITFENTQNWAVIGNELTADENDGDSGDRGIDGVTTQYADYGLIDLNTIHGHNDNYGDKGENAIDLKRESEYVVIRRNHIYNHWMEPNVTIQGGSGNVYLIGNRIRYGKQGVLVYARNDGYKAMDEVVLIANEIYGHGIRGLGLISAGDTINDVRILNNTFAYNSYDYNHPITGSAVTPSATTDSHILVENSSAWYVNNNLFYMGQPDSGSNRRAWYISSSYISAMDYNTYEHDDGETWVYDGTAKSFSTFQGADDGVSENHGDDRDPSMTDPDGTDNIYGTVDDDLTLQAGSNEIADGLDVSVSRSVDIADSDAWMIAILGFGSISIDFDEALDPAATDFSTNPPTVTLTNRSSSRDRGAYVYVAP